MSRVRDLFSCILKAWDHDNSELNFVVSLPIKPSLAYLATVIHKSTSAFCLQILFWNYCEVTVIRVVGNPAFHCVTNV